MAIQVIDFGKDTGTTARRRLADLPDRVVEGDPNHESTLFFESPDGKMIAGTWTSTPGKWHAFTDRDEFCYILSGHVRLIAEDGSAQTFRGGDAFLIPDGFRGYWEVIETTTKHFVIRDHAAE
ncbi:MULTISPECIES: cupin domain-containing protein [unclassified Halomonas]|uniref:cupin domain-containing protein n=1 Tax=unclassified Halomonas TaxID=2609666 RepID=UPI001E335F06|nr:MULTISPECIES: cupin domain-containing protein [unclassified Halomonas]MDT0502730.1 cupin domain-containing protein [Halomonas sp. PAR7]MDT0513656.1 cupin domain-containing protein [Halomonas sp. LES1]MDT0593174.1 cupin domain-containing protein [Halomonas sp. PAR8]